jgi:DNA uptake protein ComE-like DNA-binding protein
LNDAEQQAIPSDTAQGQSSPARRAVRRNAVLFIALLGPVIAWSGWSTWNAPAVHRTANPPAQTTIDPNTAQWWELTVIPGIGPALARRIIEYRESPAAGAPDGRAFHRPEDLQQVHGIGPRTVEKMTPYLSFK